MDGNSTSPLLSALGAASNREQTSNQPHESEESTPLLSHTDDAPRYDGEAEDEGHCEQIPPPAATYLRSLKDSRFCKPNKPYRRWPTFVAVSILGFLVLAIMGAVFFTPAIAEEYAKQSMVIEPTKLSIEKFTSNGVDARIQANFKLDASRVKNDVVRNIGRLGTWIAREIESAPSKIEVYLPEYGNLLIGTALVPRVVVDIRNGHSTHIDLVAELIPGELGNVRQVVNDWLEGRLSSLQIKSKGDIALKSGLFPFGTQTISAALVFEGDDIPTLPQYSITKLDFREVQILVGRRGMAADVSLLVSNSYPINLEIPPLTFDILVPNCASNAPYILLADASTDAVVVEEFVDIRVNVAGIIRQLPDDLTKACPHSTLSPLDIFLGDYIHGQDTKIFVRGSSSPILGTPSWISDFISSITVPIMFPRHSIDRLIKNFTLSDVHFALPDPFATPGTPEANPTVSGDIQVLAGLPKGINFGLNVSRVRASADVFYKEKKLGVLDLKKWQAASSTQITDDGVPAIKIKSRINDAPLNVTDEDVFTEVVQALFFGDSKPVILKVKALVDVQVGTVLGDLIVRDVPGDGDIPVKPILKGGFSNLNPHVNELKILETTDTSLTFEARVNFTNPTEYTARVPYINIHILSNGSVIGQATAKNINVSKGSNTNLLVTVVWDPYTLGGKKAKSIGRDLISQYISGFNISLTVKTHNGTIPSQPTLGEALSKFEIHIPTPRLSTPDEDGGNEPGGNSPQFIKDATFHIFSSTATFTLVSPLRYSTLYIESVNATAFYNKTDPVGKILHDLPFKVPPGVSTTPKLPVGWSIDSVGYEKLRKAIGGELKLEAEGEIGVRLGDWREDIWYIGSGIGAYVRL